MKKQIVYLSIIAKNPTPEQEMGEIVTTDGGLLRVEMSRRKKDGILYNSEDVVFPTLMRYANVLGVGVYLPNEGVLGSPHQKIFLASPVTICSGNTLCLRKRELEMSP